MEAGQALDYQPRPVVCAKKKQRDRLIGLVETHPDWALGFEDEVWWSRLAQPNMHAWSDAERPLRLVEKTRPAEDLEPKALACYGLLIKRTRVDVDQMLLRFVEERPVSAATTDFLAWSCEKLAQQGVKVLVLIWDNASWHASRQVQSWLRKHNREVKATGQGVRILVRALPSKSPWLNAIEPKWVHGKRAVAEPDGLLSAQELIERVRAYYNCVQEPHLSVTKKVA